MQISASHFTHVGEICTSKFVKTCSDDRRDCEGFTPQDVDDEFHKLYKGAYAKVCEDPSTGENCVYTDIVYSTCGSAKGAEFFASY